MKTIISVICVFSFLSLSCGYAKLADAYPEKDASKVVRKKITASPEDALEPGDVTPSPEVGERPPTPIQPSSGQKASDPTPPRKMVRKKITVRPEDALVPEDVEPLRESEAISDAAAQGEDVSHQEPDAGPLPEGEDQSLAKADQTVAPKSEPSDRGDPSLAKTDPSASGPPVPDIPDKKSRGQSLHRESDHDKGLAEEKSVSSSLPASGETEARPEPDRGKQWDGKRVASSPEKPSSETLSPTKNVGEKPSPTPVPDKPVPDVFYQGKRQGPASHQGKNVGDRSVRDDGVPPPEKTDKKRKPVSSPDVKPVAETPPVKMPLKSAPDPPDDSAGGQELAKKTRKTGEKREPAPSSPVKTEKPPPEKEKEKPTAKAGKPSAAASRPDAETPPAVSENAIASIIGLKEKKPETIDRTKPYTPEGKTDPFVPLFKEEKPISRAELEKKAKEAEEARKGKKKKTRVKRIPRTPLEKVDLGQLKLVGIIRAESGSRALVEEASGKGYIIRKGTYIGIRSGRVAEILRDRVVVEEENEDTSGEVTLRKRELKLQKPLGDIL